ncbi:hypothetical protein [Streptosporangium sp. LJ11]|uniref:hypothetical protein n=1 Tax=Streptosporangium sp. LJ11 TaxID=3436927 RepID=UPI003F7B22B3
MAPGPVGGGHAGPGEAFGIDDPVVEGLVDARPQGRVLAGSCRPVRGSEPSRRMFGCVPEPVCQTYSGVTVRHP